MDIHIKPMKVELEAVRYDILTGLVPVVVQETRSGEVLMVAYANREALKRTLGTGQAWFWSRSRKEYWHKGATSGNTQHVVDVRLDCDGDSVLYLVEAAGPACHTGATSCFYRSITHEQPCATEKLTACSSSMQSTVTELPQANCHASLDTVKQAQVDDKQVDWQGLERLWQMIVERDRTRPNGSYTTFLFEHGVDKIGKKVGEEAVEVVIAAKNAAQNALVGRVELCKESADLLYHLMVLWKSSQITPQDILMILAEREK